jgi:serine/threonine protein kinase
MDDALAAGSRLGRYEIVRRLALGGMAEIYLARMTGLAGFAKHVVVKRILPSYARDAEFVRMFLNEARYAATLDHPNISHVYDFGEEGGLYYYAMEYLHGDDCRALLRELAVKQRRLPLELALTIAIGAATGCHFAHELVGEDGRPLGLIHRDVSPSNVVVTYAGAVKLVDFGIAKATARETATAAGVTKGKLAYMAPEQCRAERLDRRVDVYALGILLYELTTQRRAFAADNDAAIVWAVMSGNVTWPIERDPSYPPALDAIVRKAMHFDRDQRYATARELAVALEEFARSHDLLIGPTRLAEFFTEIMGPRLEPWRLESEGRAATATPTPGPLAATSVLGPASADVPTYTPPGVLGPLGRPPTAPSGARPSSGSAPAPAPSPAPSRAPWIALGLLAVVGGGVALWLATRPPPAAPPIAVVTERGTAAVEVVDAGSTMATAIVDAGPPAPPPVDARASSPQRPDGGRPSRPAPDPLSAALNRHAAAINRCATEHRDIAATTPQVILRFSIDAAGTPTKVELQPAAIAATPLGECLRAIAARTQFPPQDGPAVFSLPLTIAVR